MRKFILAGLVLALWLCAGCQGAGPQGLTPKQEGDKMGGTKINDKMAEVSQTSKAAREIYLAGGCFWGMEKLMSSLPGVIRVTSGYANSSKAQPSYEEVCSGATGARETVRVEYDPQQVSLPTVLFAYFSVLDPTVENRQGNDRGSQYQTGIYYTDAGSGKVVAQAAAAERKRWGVFKVEIKPLENFYPAEEYHQKYLEKHPGGYCHISPRAIERVKHLKVDAGDYQRPAEAEIKARLTPAQYEITQNRGTEPPFKNDYNGLFLKGIYVDVVTGEPLFSSTDKFESGCGWPAFSKPIDPNVVVEQTDTSFGMRRTEVTSRTGSSHLGHVFYGEGVSPTGDRYCIDSASLRFIPYEEMEAKGYGKYKALVK